MFLNNKTLDITGHKYVWNNGILFVVLQTERDKNPSEINASQSYCSSDMTWWLRLKFNVTQYKTCIIPFVMNNIFTSK